MDRILLMAGALALDLSGYALLIWVDWRIALAVFFINWSRNIARRRLGL